MIVTCEKCHTKFRISHDESSKIKDSGRVLKCGNCHHMWLASKSVNPFALHFDSHTPTDQPLIEQLKKDHDATLTLMNTIPDDPVRDYFRIAHIPVVVKIAFYSSVFFLILALLIIHKDFFTTYLKPIKPIMAVIGLHDTKGLEFEKVRIIKSSFKEGKPLIISGYIINKSNKTLLIPDIRLQFKNEAGEVLQSITHDLPIKLLSPDEKGKIANRIEEYPEDTYIITMDIGNYLEFLIR